AQVGAGRRLTLVLTRTPEAVQDQERGSPPRLVLDLDGPRPAEPRQVTAFPLSDELVSRVRVGSFGGKLRAIVDLSHAPGAHAVRSEGAKVIVDLGDTSLAAATPARAARKRPGALGAAAAPAAAMPVETPGAPPAGDPTPLAVRDVKVEPMGEGRRLVIELTRPPDDVRDFTLSAPPRPSPPGRRPLRPLPPSRPRGSPPPSPRPNSRRRPPPSRSRPRPPSRRRRRPRTSPRCRTRRRRPSRCAAKRPSPASASPST